MPNEETRRNRAGESSMSDESFISRDENVTFRAADAIKEDWVEGEVRGPYISGGDLVRVLSECEKSHESEYAKRVAEDEKSGIFTGVVKVSNKEDEIMFAPLADVSQWIRIPVTEIEKALVHYLVPYQGRIRYLVKLFLKQPNSIKQRIFSAESDADIAGIQDIDRILERLDAGIPEAQRTMDALLSRLRMTRLGT